MGHTVIGVFRYSGDADLAAAYLREEYTLAADELDVIGQLEWESLSRPASDDTRDWGVFASLTGMGLHSALGDEDPVGKRWGDKLFQGESLVVARTGDPEIAQIIAGELRRIGADLIDLLPH